MMTLRSTFDTQEKNYAHKDLILNGVILRKILCTVRFCPRQTIPSVFTDNIDPPRMAN